MTEKAYKIGLALIFVIAMAVMATILFFSQMQSRNSIQTAKAQSDERRQEMQYSFTSRDGRHITASVYPATGDRKLILFVPFLRKDDSEYFAATTLALRNIYNNQEGVLVDRQLSYDSIATANTISWRVATTPKDKSTTRFYTYPVKDSDSGDIAAITVWVR